ncbi:GNAT family N-acetyltransferase [Metabacillus herbersteinensis]|uniref:GNAT family N-acetyltransferase n=1 Tax=Metabacillus herbersteinensis TaxID=283816 RepID=A0ABV6GH21_9BACI
MRIFDTERLRLRPLKVGDSQEVEELAREYDVSKSTLTIPHPYPEGSAKDFIEKVLDSEKRGELFNFAITSKETQNLIGMINIKLSGRHSRGELGYWIGKPFWNIGYGTEAARAVLEFGFNDLNLNKVYAQAFKETPGSWRIMEKIGLKYEGTLKQHVYRFEI